MTADPDKRGGGKISQSNVEGRIEAEEHKEIKKMGEMNEIGRKSRESWNDAHEDMRNL